MAPIPGTPEYQPSTVQKIKGEVYKRIPFYFGRLVQLIMYGIFQLVQFIIQVIKDAFSR
jgi:hypothetical protein